MSNRTVHHSFVHEGVYYTNENIDKLPADAVEDRVKRGYISEGDTQATGSLVGIGFASIAAADAAHEAGLNAMHFDGREPSSDRGFTVDDVRTISQEG